MLRTQAGYLIESVIMRTGTGRVSLCVSSQVGCAAACGFCATGQMGIAKNLSAAEILDQVVLAGERMQAEGRRVRNIVFMGMGEPFHNEERLRSGRRPAVARNCSTTRPAAFSFPRSAFRTR